MNRRTAYAIVALPVALATFRASGQAADYHRIAMAGQGAPGLPGVTFDSISDPRITARGTVAFWATLAGTGITSDNNESIWVVRDGVPLLAYQEGAPAFGTTGTLGGLASFDLNESGRVAFAASIFESATPNAPTNVAYFAESDTGTSACWCASPRPHRCCLRSFRSMARARWRGALGRPLFRRSRLRLRRRRPCQGSPASCSKSSPSLRWEIGATLCSGPALLPR